MDDSLTWNLVWNVAVHPKYACHRRKCADRMHRLIVGAKVAGETPETDLRGMMEVLSVLSEHILHDYGYATRWMTPRIRTERYYPLHIQALALHSHCEYDDVPVESNPLGGVRV